MLHGDGENVGHTCRDEICFPTPLSLRLNLAHALDIAVTWGNFSGVQWDVRVKIWIAVLRSVVQTSLQSVEGRR